MNVVQEGDELVIMGGRVFRTNQCWDPTPALQRVAHSANASGRAWSTRCATPPNDPRRATITTNVVDSPQGHYAVPLSNVIAHRYYRFLVATADGDQEGNGGRRIHHVGDFDVGIAMRFAHELVTNESHINLSRHCQILSFGLGSLAATGPHRFRRDLNASRIPSEKPGTAWVHGESWIEFRSGVAENFQHS